MEPRAHSINSLILYLLAGPLFSPAPKNHFQQPPGGRLYPWGSLVMACTRFRVHRDAESTPETISYRTVGLKPGEAYQAAGAAVDVSKSELGLECQQKSTSWGEEVGVGGPGTERRGRTGSKARK